jgi:hypothetical protein
MYHLIKSILRALLPERALNWASGWLATSEVGLNICQHFAFCGSDPLESCRKSEEGCRNAEETKTSKSTTFRFENRKERNRIEDPNILVDEA